MAEKGFDLATMLQNVSKLDTGRNGVLQMIPAREIHPNERNFYDVSDVDGLIDAILLDGLQSPLVVNRMAPDSYTIISGHRRFAALSRIIADGLDVAPGKLFAGEIASGRIPCLVNEYRDDLQAELALIRANSDTRVLSSAETSRQIERTEQLLYEMKNRGYSFPGKMRDYVAEVCQVSASKIARLKVIREKLIPELAQGFEKEQLKESVAYALAQMTPELQQQVLNYKNGDQMQYWAEWSVKDVAEKIRKVTSRTCKRCGGGPCQNAAAMLDKLFKSGDCSYKPCDHVCCAKCSNLAKCKSACPLLADKVKKLKTDAKEKSRQEKAAKEARDAPTIQKIQEVWTRFGVARTQARKSYKDLFEAMDRYYSRNSDAVWSSLEDGNAKVTTDTALPYGYSLRWCEAEKLVKAADAMRCSVDYLLCRTDDPQGGGQTAAPAWRSGEDAPEPGQEAVVRFRVTGMASPLRRIAMWDGQQWRFSQHGAVIDAECIAWFPLPAEEVASHE